MSAAALAGAGAALAWVLLALRWFDEAAGFRPAWVAALPPAVLAAAVAGLSGLWAWRRRAALLGPLPTAADAGVGRAALLSAALALAFRLPLALHGGAGYLTPDGALSGIVALRLHEGTARLVFVPSVAYSGSLKSHLAAVLMAAFDPARAFALASLLFYAAFAAAVCRLAAALPAAEPLEEGRPARRALAAGLYTAFAPAFVTRYSLSNDGNYVEVLALGTWALVAALRWRRQPAGAALALVIGLLLGLAFWCHVLALVSVLAVGGWMALAGLRRALRAVPAAAFGFFLGAWPALIWNAGHSWDTFRYLVPGGEGMEPARETPAARLREIFLVQLPVLLGYDPGYAPAVDLLFRALAWGAVAALALAVAAAARALWRGPRDQAAPLALPLLLLGVNLALVLLALRVVPGNPRYLLFATPAVAALLAWRLAARRWRWAMALLVAFGAAGSLAQAPGAWRGDAQWRAFVAGLEGRGVRFCHTDFYIATKVNFLSQERVVCSAKLGPTTTEYFVDFRRRAEQASRPALVAVNATNAEKLERRLQRLGVGYERLDLMKPVLVPLSRTVDPQELFPERDFPLR